MTPFCLYVIIKLTNHIGSNCKIEQKNLNEKIVESLKQPNIVNDSNSLIEVTDEMLVPLMNKRHENSIQVKAVD